MKELKIGDIILITKGKKVSNVFDSNNTKESYARYLQIEDLRHNNNLKYTNEVNLIKVNENDAIIAWDGSKAGTVNYGLNGIIGSTLARLIIKEKYKSSINPSYFGLFLQFNYEYFQKTNTGAAIPHVSKNALNDLKIPLPDLQTQQQIVTVLDKAQSLIKKREQSLELLDELLRATFLDMFGDPVLNEKNLKFTKLNELGVWKSGGTPSRSIDAYFKGDIPWFSSGELNDMYISKSNEKITEVAVKKTSAKLIESGSLLVGMYDTAALKSSITKIVASCNQAIAFAKLNEKKCTSTFVYFAIQIGRKYHLSKRRGVRQRNLNLAMIKALEIPLPKLNQQEIFSSIVSKIELQKELIQKSLDDLKNLFQSLLQDAFNGTLKLQDEKIELQTALRDVNWFTEQLGEINGNPATKKLLANLNAMPKVPSAFSNIYDLQKKLSGTNLALDKIRSFQNSLGTNNISHLKFVNSLPTFKLLEKNPFLKEITNNQSYTLKNLEQAKGEQKEKELEKELRKENDPILQFINQEQLGKYTIENYKVNIPKTIYEYFGKTEFNIDILIQALEENKGLLGLKKDTIKKDLFLIFTQFIKVKYDGLFAFKQMREEMQSSLFNPAFTLLQEFIDQGLKNKSIEQVYSLASVGDEIRGNDKRMYLSLKQSKHEDK
ncbi:restriction endonuclease subunit S [uncultured Aquimarina sp.]|uniref:restriction endonuclease subunit S n=1 Tax=uncultured Aquimarina sp. TaxID=575652 RepID=UPI00261862D2|nr:restriction endonuclease subunit S [uncultured Aquimarina sp.]